MIWPPPANSLSRNRETPRYRRWPIRLNAMISQHSVRLAPPAIAWRERLLCPWLRKLHCERAPSVSNAYSSNSNFAAVLSAVRWYLAGIPGKPISSADGDGSALQKRVLPITGRFSDQSPRKASARPACCSCSAHYVILPTLLAEGPGVYPQFPQTPHSLQRLPGALIAKPARGVNSNHA